MAPYLKCLLPLPFWAVGLWLFLSQPLWLGVMAFLAMFLLGSVIGTALFKRYATEQQIKEDLRSRLAND